MRFYRLLGQALLLISATLLLSGCGQKYASLYKSLPINTDGNPLGNIVLVEFLDYSDPVSLKMAPIISQAIEKRTNVRVVYHPIITDPQKAYYTRLILAASLQDRFLAAHQLTVKAKHPLTEQNVIDLLSQSFIDPQELSRQENSNDVNTLLASNSQLAKKWQVNTVPTFFIGRINHKPVRLTGAQTLEQLLAIIDEETAK